MMRLSIGGSIHYHNLDTNRWELAFPLNRR